jgi:hypothetical protein
MPSAGKVFDALEGRAEEDAICKFAAFLVSVLMVYSGQAGPGVSHGL